MSGTAQAISETIKSDLFNSKTKQLLTRAQVQERYQINDQTMSYLIKSGQIPFIRISRRVVRFDLATLEEWEKKRRNAEFGSTSK
jgi:hypothetical protein